MQSITDLLTPLPAAAIRQAMVNVLVTLGIRADLWRKGGIASTILTVVSSQFSNFQALIVLAVGSGFLTIATGGWLTLLAFYVFGVTRPAATFASGFVRLTNTGGGVYDFGPGQVTFLNSTTQKTYRNVNALHLGALAVLNNFAIEAVEAGSASSANPGEIDALVTTMLGVEVTNPLAVVGADALDDPGLVALCQAKLASLSVRGPSNAYAWAVSQAKNSSGNPVNINRVAVSEASHTGVVTVYVASPSGAPTFDDVVAAKASVLALARPQGVTALVIPVSTTPYTQTITVWAKSTPGLSAADLKTGAADAVSLLLSTYPIGGLSTDTFTGLYASGVDAVIGGTSATIFDITGTADLALLPGEVAVDATTIVVRVV